MTREEINKHYENIRDIVNYVRISWHFFDQLFRSGEDNLRLLSKSAGHLFRRVYDSLYVTVLLRICTLTDPDRTNNRYDNLSFKKLAKQIQELDGSAGTTILNQIEAEQSHFVHLRNLRDKSIAHTDLETFGTHSGPAKEIDSAIEALLRILDCFEDYLKPSEKRWRYIPHFPPGSDGGALLSILRHREELIAERNDLINISSLRDSGP
ncbi:MAG: hypothetical protein ACHQNE_02225 [Candidatus Kapaibacterium sp.]